MSPISHARRALPIATLLLLGALAGAPAAPAATTVTDLPDELVPFSVVAGPDGRAWFVAADRHLYGDFGSDSGESDYFYRGVVGSIGSAGDIRVVAEGRGNDSALNALPREPVFAGDGNLYGAGGSSGDVVRVTPAGEVRTISAAPGGKGVSGVALGDDDSIWFGSVRGEGRFVGRIAPDLSAQAFTAGLQSSPTRLVAGLGSPLWLIDSEGRLMRVAGDGRSRRIQMPRSSNLYGLTRSSDDRIWIVNGGKPHPGLWRVGRRGPALTTCSFRPRVTYPDIAPGADGSVWALVGGDGLGGGSYPARISRTGKVVAYPNALPTGDTVVWDVAAGPGGSLLVAYRRGPSDDLRHQTGHVATVTPTGGKRLCSRKLRKVPKTNVKR
jgi:streptogramin lyase